MRSTDSRVKAAMKAIKQVLAIQWNAEKKPYRELLALTHSFTSWVKHYVAKYQETKGGCHDR